MSKINLLNLLLCILLLFSITGCAKPTVEEPSPVVIDGTLDTSGSTASVALVGKWAFWPNQFINPAACLDTFTRFESFPSSWSVYKPELFPQQGYASYAVAITGLDPSIEYGFRFPAYSCAATYFVNGRELYSQGTPANNRKNERPFWDTKLIPIPMTGATNITLVLYLSNFNDIYSASSVPISFGSFEVLRQESTLNRILMIIPFGAILAMGAYFLSLFVFHHEESSSFWLGLLCLVFALRIVCYDEFILLDIFPFISPNTVFRLGYLTFSLASAVLFDLNIR